MATSGTTGQPDRGYDLRGLLERLDRPTKRPARGGSVRDEHAVSSKTRLALRQGRISGKIQWLLQRRATRDGQILPNVLRDARRDRAEHLERARAERAGVERLRGALEAPAVAGCNWFSVGPRNINGRIKCLAVHPNGTTVYAGAADGGVWKTTDSGQSWTPTMHDELSLAIGALALDPNSPQTVYAGTGEPVYLLSGTGVEPPGSPD